MTAVFFFSLLRDILPYMFLLPLSVHFLLHIIIFFRSQLFNLLIDLFIQFLDVKSIGFELGPEFLIREFFLKFKRIHVL